MSDQPIQENDPVPASTPVPDLLGPAAERAHLRAAEQRAHLEAAAERAHLEAAAERAHLVAAAERAHLAAAPKRASVGPAAARAGLAAGSGASAAPDTAPAGIPHVVLSNGVAVPQVGFGTFQIPPDDTQRAVEQALELGYRHIDTAAAYYNEAGVGAAVRASGLPRDEVFVTTKLRNADHGAGKAIEAFEASRRALGLEVVDLYLIHWPVPSRDLFVETWQALQGLAEEGAVRALGVSNFLPEHLERLVAETGAVPTVDQIEVHPTFSQPAVREAARLRGISVEAYSPLGQGADLAEPEITGIAARLGVTPAQVVLRWHVQSGRIVIPKSVHPRRMRDNLDVVGFELSDEDVRAIDALDRADGRIGGDPATFSFPQTREDAAARGEGVD